jgi:2-keto-4-pentenoate hydratase/2-oxohepta-3-ene-1,7-dioic acid hydratase in catechol pathway
MRYATLLDADRGRLACVIDPARGAAPIVDLLPGFTGDLLEVIRRDLRADIEAAARDAGAGAFRPLDAAGFGAPYLHPRMIWGIGLNYVDHAADLAELVPEEPASFVKGDHTIIGPGDPIPLPVQSERTTAEGEVGLVIGRECRNVGEDEALDHVFGLVTILDQTAEDILQRNPRFLTRSKNFPGFFSFGPQIVPLDEAVPAGSRLADLEVATVINGAVHRTAPVSRMRYSPEFLVSFHSRVFPLQPGDIISTGTPGAVVIRPGDVVEARVTGLPALSNPVVAGAA